MGAQEPISSRPFPKWQAPPGESVGASFIGFLRMFGREFDYRTTGISLTEGRKDGSIPLAVAYREGWPAGGVPGGARRASDPSLTRLHIRDPVTLDSDVGAPCRKIDAVRPFLPYSHRTVPRMTGGRERTRWRIDLAHAWRSFQPNPRLNPGSDPGVFSFQCTLR